ncbi:MAG: homoserine O-acetyltransferase [Bacteroidota bacterium]
MIENIDIIEVQYLKYKTKFETDSGFVFPELDIAYHTYGTLNVDKNNVVWVCHALTANSDALDWWDGLVGEGRIFDPKHYFIVCANMLGSCYGATNPSSINPSTKKPYGKDFPVITVRDMVRSHQILQQHLGIDKIRLLLGGSMGGQQALEWAIMDSKLFDRVAIFASNAKHSAWGIAFNESQRMALMADQTLYSDDPNAGQKGLEAARSIAMLSYRHYDTYQSTQTDNDDRIDDFRASSYQRYQGLKLWKRFEPLSYIILGKAMDNHNVGRDRGGIKKALQKIEAPTLVVGIQSDILFPISEQQFMAKYIPDAQFEAIDSLYGHDGFLIEYQKMTYLLEEFLAKGAQEKSALSDMKKTEMPGTELF